MIEWWQAGLSILLTGLLTIAAGVVAWLLNSRTARETQDREHRHTTELELRRERAERQVRREEALREYQRGQAEPFYEFLGIVERLQGRRLLGNMMRAGGGQRRFEEYLHGLDPAMRDKIGPEVWENLSAIWEELVQADTQPDFRWQDVVKKYSQRILLVADEELRGTLVQLLGHVASGQQPHLSEQEVATLLAEARQRMVTLIVDSEPPREETTS